MDPLIHLDPLESMLEDRDILGLMDPEETADVLRSLHDVLDKDVDMEIDADDINNNSIIPDSLGMSGSTATGLGYNENTFIPDNLDISGSVVDYACFNDINIVQSLGLTKSSDCVSNYNNNEPDALVVFEPSEKNSNDNNHASTRSRLTEADNLNSSADSDTSCVANQLEGNSAADCGSEKRNHSAADISGSSVDNSSSTDEACPAPGLRRSARNKEYNLRTSSIQNRIETEQRRRKPKTPKPKNKPAPLSKYRRKTANSRERSRMQEVNDAFEELQKVVPDLPAGNGKRTKITTLHLAMDYISALRDMLGFGDPLGLSCSPCGSSMDCASPGVFSASSVSSTESPRTSVDSDKMSVSDRMSILDYSPEQRLLLDSEGESCYST